VKAYNSVAYSIVNGNKDKAWAIAANRLFIDRNEKFLLKKSS